MASILLWVGIVLTVTGWIALAWLAAKRMSVKDELNKFPERKSVLQLRRNYCWLTIIAGVILILLSVVV